MTEWDLVGTNDAIDVFENEIIKKVINPIDDFETIRYSHEPWVETINGIEQTSIDYEFYFYNVSTNNSVTAETTSTNWILDYRANDITTRQIYFDEPVFKNSFFKLDFYDTKNTTNQQIYLTIIIPTSQGSTMTTQYGYKTVNIRKPKFILNSVGDKDGYYIYWLKSTEFIDLNKLYMSVKFFDANIGQFKRMMTTPQGLLQDKFNFPTEEYFYYAVDINYDNHTYVVSLESSNGDKTRVGTTNSPIKWYEYINPQ